jgi:hypothetical protein
MLNRMFLNSLLSLGFDKSNCWRFKVVADTLVEIVGFLSYEVKMLSDC